DMNCRTVSIVYGQTEASPIITMSAPEDPIDKRVSTVGRSFPNVETKVIDPATGSIKPIGQQGEICARGYLVMQGYDGEPQAPAPRGTRSANSATARSPTSKFRSSFVLSMHSR